MSRSIEDEQLVSKDIAVELYNWKLGPTCVLIETTYTGVMTPGRLISGSHLVSKRRSDYMLEPSHFYFCV